MWELLETPADTGQAMCAAFADELIQQMKTNNKIVAMDADLGNASKFSGIKKVFPKQFIEMGIAEANMIGVAAGMSLRGFIPFVHSFAPFATRRVADQIYMSGVYSSNTINIYGSDPGVCAAANGGTHSSYEDIALLRAFPTMEIFDPADTVQLKWLIGKLAQKKGVHYIRATRKETKQIYKEQSQFEMGRGNILMQGKDVVIFSMGILLADALYAAKTLKELGVLAQVVDLFCIKPLDRELVLQCAMGKKLAATFENHSIYGGIGSAIAEILAENKSAPPLIQIGVKDRFGQVGSVEYLKKIYGLTSDHLVSSIVGKLRTI